VKAHLARARVNVTTSDPASTLLDATARSLPAIVRASPHYYNTEEEVYQVAMLVERLASSAAR
jgi:cysteine desulfurase / selenocysteine lyase